MVSIDTRLTAVKLSQFKTKDGQEPLDGSLVGRAILEGRGKSLHEVGSTVAGSLTIVVPHGDIRNAFAELMGINAANELINLGGNLAARYALLLAPLSLVQAISGTTTLFVFGFGVLLTLFLPKFGREDLSWHNLLQKGGSALLIAAGVALVGGSAQG